MKKFFVILLLVLLLIVPFKAVAAEFKAFLIPWIVTSEHWWGALNIKNLSDTDVTVTIRRFNEDGDPITGIEELFIPGYENRNWVIAPDIRSIIVEGNDSIFITAFLMKGDGSVKEGLTELKVHDITTVKN